MNIFSNNLFDYKNFFDGYVLFYKDIIFFAWSSTISMGDQDTVVQYIHNTSLSTKKWSQLKVHC